MEDQIVLEGSWETVSDVYESEYQRILKDKTILVNHLGEFSLEFVFHLCEEFERVLVSKNENKVVIKRMFSILLEGLQNLRLHGEKDDNGVQSGYLIIASTEDYYKIIVANVIHLSIVEKLLGYLKKLNSYDQKELKELYLSVLDKEFSGEIEKAGLGIITTRMKSMNPLGFTIHKMNDELALFSFKVFVDRK